MATAISLQNDESPKDNNNNSPDVDKAFDLPLIVSICTEYCDSDEEIYRDNVYDTSNSDDVELNNNHRQHQSTADTKNQSTVSYSRLKDNTKREREEKDKIDKYWRQLVLYIIYNSLRFLLIGIIILIVNIRHANDVQNFKNGNDKMVCCLCYNYAKYQQVTYRMDWSMCYEPCNHCKSCENINDSNDECKMPSKSMPMEFMDSVDTINSDECPEKLSITSFKFFVKNYLFYGVGALSCVIVYIIFMIVASIINKATIISSAVVFIFANIQISLVCAYCITKPYQYYLETFSYDTFQFECYKDSLNEDIENILSLVVNCAVIFVVLPFLLCCCRCIILRNDSYRIRKIYAMVMKIIFIVAIIGCIAGTIALTWISIKVAKKHNDEGSNIIDGNLFDNATVTVIAINLFMFLSVFDICMFCEFCRDKISTIYMVRYSPYITHKDWEFTISENKSMQTASNYGN